MRKVSSYKISNYFQYIIFLSLKFPCRYGPRTSGIKSVCRHCTCKTDELVKGGEIFEENRLYTPEMLDPDAFDQDYFKSISHHPIQNAFHEIDFGANRFNIHLATPGELLHMVQKGVCIRAIEGFVEMWKNPSVEQDDVTAVENTNKSMILLTQLDHLGKVYGGYLSRQSDRDRPRTKFRSSLFSNCKVSTTHCFFNMAHHANFVVRRCAPHIYLNSIFLPFAEKWT